MKNILVPIDFSDYATNALQVAASIAKQQNATITVIHMLGISDGVLASNAIQEQAEVQYYLAQAKKRFNAYLDKPYLKDLKITKIIQNYKIFSELNAIALEQHSDLIVMGSHGASGFNELFIGSNTEKVVRTSDIPVLIIKSPIPNFKIKKILFACNFSEEAELAFKNIQTFAEKFSAKLKLIYINTPYNYLSTDETHVLISKFMLKALEPMQKVEIYNDYSVEEGLMNYSKKEKFDLIAIATHGRQGLQHFFIGSISEDLANHSNLPILTIKI